MHEGDRSRKNTLVQYGFRLPSALDNRPARFEEWEAIVKREIFVSATPGRYELEKCLGEVVELINRPTGLLDPEVEVRGATGQVPDLVEEIRRTVQAGDRVLVTTLTKRMAEDLNDHFQDEGIRSMYLHSEIQTFERVEILENLRRGKHDVVVGVNLLREGLDLPEVSLVAILDADKEGFLRSETSLVQTIGRAARHERARVILYADSETRSMKLAMEETKRRRHLQEAFNRAHGIKPRSIRKPFRSGIVEAARSQKVIRDAVGDGESRFEVREQILGLEKKMLEHARALEFEEAAAIRDRIESLRSGLGDGSGNRGVSREGSTPGGAARARRKSRSSRGIKASGRSRRRG